MLARRRRVSNRLSWYRMGRIVVDIDPGSIFGRPLVLEQDMISQFLNRFEFIIFTPYKNISFSI
jgi:hypothetical protein